jgi:hypothetical protein
MVANDARETAHNSLPDEIDRAFGVLGRIENSHVVEDRLDVTGEAALLRFHFGRELEVALLEGDAGIGLGEIVQLYERNSFDLELGVECRPGRVGVELDAAARFALAQRPPFHLDLGDERF